MIVYSKDRDRHLKYVTEVIKRLSDSNLTVNMSKAKFFYQEIGFLGNIVKQDSVTIDPERTAK